MRIKVFLDHGDLAEADRIAQARRREAASGSYRRLHPGTLREDMLGAQGELAVARWIGIRHPGWGGDVSWAADVSRGSDVAGWQVRTASVNGYGLALNRPDKGSFILALAHESPVIWLAGWIDADTGRAAGVLRHDGVGQRDWWRVDESWLRPLAERGLSPATKCGLRGCSDLAVFAGIRCPEHFRCPSL